MGHCIITCRAITTIIIIIVITIDVAMFLPIISVDLTTKNSSPASSPPALFSFIIHRADQVYTIHKVLFLLCAIILSPALLSCSFLLSVDGFGSLLSFSSFASFSLSLVIVFICVLRSFAHHLVYGPSRVTPYVMLFFAPQSQPDSSASHR